MKGIVFLKDEKGRTLKAKVDLGIHQAVFEKFFGKNAPNVVNLKSHQTKFRAFCEHTAKNTPRIRKPDLPPMMPPPARCTAPVRMPDIPSLMKPIPKSVRPSKQPDIPNLIKPKY